MSNVSVLVRHSECKKAWWRLAKLCYSFLILKMSHLDVGRYVLEDGLLLLNS